MTSEKTENITLFMATQTKPAYHQGGKAEHAENEDFFITQIYGTLRAWLSLPKPLSCDELINDLKQDARFSPQQLPILLATAKPFIEEINHLPGKKSGEKDLNAIKVLTAVRERLITTLVSGIEGSASEAEIMESIKAIRTIRAMLNTAIMDAKKSPFHVFVQKPSNSSPHLVSFPQGVGARAGDGENQPLTQLTEPPVKWAERATFAVDSVADGHTRQKLQSHPDLVEKIRACSTDNVLAFLDIVYGDYINAGFGQKELRKLDKRLFDLCGQACKDAGIALNTKLPTLSQKIDREIQSLGIPTSPDPKISSLLSTAYARSRRSRQKN